MTEIAVQDLTEVEAREFVEHVRASVEDLKDWIVRAVKGRAWIALGYRSWDEMCEAEFDGAVIRLPREDRRDAVASLREAGLSTRAIGSALGVDHKTVVNDMQSTGENSPVAPETVTSLDGRQRPASQPHRPTPPSRRPDPEPGIWYAGPDANEPADPAPAPDLPADQDRADDAVRVVDEAIARHLPADPEAEVREWRRNFLAALSAARRPLQFRAADVGERADAECLDELARFVADLTKYYADVQASGRGADVIQMGARR